MNKLTVRSILDITYISLTENKNFFLTLVLLIIVVNQIFEFVIVKIVSSNAMMAFFVSVISSLFIAKLTIMIHRSILLQEFDIKNIFSWSFTEIKFIFTGILIGLLSFVLVGIVMSIVMAIFGALSTPSIMVIAPMLLTVLLGGLIACRLALVLPSIAVEQDMTFSKAWEESRIHLANLFFLIIGVPILFMALTFALMSIDIDSELLLFVVESLHTLVWVYEVAIITHCYERLFVKPEIQTTQVV